MGGAKSQAFGSLFESVFLKACRSNGVAVTRIPDGCRQFGKKIIRIPTPWDWVITFEGKSALIDTKTVQGDSFPISAITGHQVSELSRHGDCGAIAGYVVWFRNEGNVVFLPADILMQAVIKNKRGSFSKTHSSAISLGSLKLYLEFDIRKIFTTLYKPLHKGEISDPKELSEGGLRSPSSS